MPRRRSNLGRRTRRAEVVRRVIAIQTRIPMIPTDMPFQFKRLQFPIRLAFAITINKAQGQSFELCGLHLHTDCFSHGQLYVACSRVGKSDNLYICTDSGTTKNIVYHKHCEIIHIRNVRFLFTFFSI
jgi:ATP-dependent DNA helicase PIF1